MHIKFKAQYIEDYPDQEYEIRSYYRWLGYTRIVLLGADGLYYRPFNFELEKGNNGKLPEGEAEIGAENERLDAHRLRN